MKKGYDMPSMNVIVLLKDDIVVTSQIKSEPSGSTPQESFDDLINSMNF